MKNAADFLRDTIDLVRQVETRFLELGARLHKIYDEELWKNMYDSYQEFLDTAHISAGNDSMLRAVHRAYEVEGKMARSKLAGIGYSNLYSAIPLIESRGVEEAVVNAQTLTRDEIKNAVRQRKHGECQHEDTITICAKCHKKVE